MPDNLAAAETISRSEAKAAKFKSLLPGQIVEIELDWGTLRIVPQQIVVITSKAPFVRAADLALKITRDAARAAAVTMFGINRQYLYKFTSRDARDELGRRLAPPSAWGAWGGELDAEMKTDAPDSPQHSGLMSMTMRKMNLVDREAGWLDLSITSAGTSPTDIGVVIRANDHYQFSPEKDPDSLVVDSHGVSRTLRLLDTLVSNFDASIKRSDSIIHGLVSQ